jgi:hypothetical protein
VLPEYFAVIGAVIASLGGLYYLYETLTGKSQPNRITWLLWGIFPLITFVAQRAQGVNGVSWASFVAGLTPLIIVIASFFNKKAYWKSRKVDYICMLIGFVGITLWAVTNIPNLAILFAIGADLSAGIPTFIKSFRHPETESWIAYAISTIGFSLSMLTIDTWTLENYAFLTYLVAANALLALFSSRKKSKDPFMTEVA